MIYYHGIHLHQVLKCLDAGHLASAVSWIDRDIGERHGVEEGDYPWIDSLVKLEHPTLGTVVGYKTIKEMTIGLDGDGI